jgi:hypothetical protein
MLAFKKEEGPIPSDEAFQNLNPTLGKEGL